MVGALQVSSPFGFWWLTPATVYAMGLAFIAAVSVGLSVASGRPRVIVVECIVAGVFAVVADAGALLKERGPGLAMLSTLLAADVFPKILPFLAGNRFDCLHPLTHAAVGAERSTMTMAQRA